uniref:GTP-binding protein HSR1-related n=1 Tax=Cyanothece sp. (strain PCC 7425 / ATCC 29141) TaxID=395961 RepID=B8HM65_CYAP4
MVRLSLGQGIVLVLPIALVIGFIMVAAGRQIHHWQLDWLWAVFLLVFLGWRWLLVRWLKPPELPPTEVPPAITSPNPTQTSDPAQQVEVQIQAILQQAREDPPIWEDWRTFWQRCLAIVTAIAQVYAPQVKRPLLHIYVPQAYRLLRDTVDDVDRWMAKLSPVLGQVTVGQAYTAYETYRQLEPTARLALKLWNWAQWVLNPAVAIARTTTEGYSTQANQQLLVNLGQILREETLRALASRAIALYSGEAKVLDLPPPQPTQTLRDLLIPSSGQETLAQQPVNLMLVGRTGAGKSSLINTLFVQPLAEVDLLPSTDRLQDYHWSSPSGETLILWDTPGYEQVGRPELREEVLDHLETCDALLLVTPATDPALQMDLDFLQLVRTHAPDLPILVVVTQVDRLRPIREWQPPYNWQSGDRPKETAIRGAVEYRQSRLDQVQTLLPLVTADPATGRREWGTTALAETLLTTLDPAKQFRLARFLRDQEARLAAATRIIDHYTFQMGTTQGLTALLKSPILSFISTLMTGSPTLAILLAQKLPIEQSPVVLGKLQMAYELFSLLADQTPNRPFDLLSLWPLLLDNPEPVTPNAWAFGHTLAEYWSGNAETDLIGADLTEQLRQRFQYFLSQKS